MSALPVSAPKSSAPFKVERRIIDYAQEKNRLFHAIETVPVVKKKADWALKWITRCGALAGTHMQRRWRERAQGCASRERRGRMCKWAGTAVRPQGPANCVGL